MKINILIALLVILILVGCENFGNKDNPMFGKVFRDANELPDFKGYDEIGGSVIESSKDEEGDFRFGFTHLQKKDKHIIILDEISKPSENGKVKFKILDTIYIDNVKENQFIAYGNCSQGNVSNEEIIALVIDTDDENDYDKIIKAWYADTKNGRIKPITNTKGIKCKRVIGSGDEEIDESVPIDTIDFTDTTINTLESQKKDSLDLDK
ncbi:MAG: hypothetical protein J7604_18765 [Sporocytophaga sp.]|uniref:hypothetical protein n=1 Tax=Sporocytophaga sp. TaxID=2231183 RepID=UPI001B155027|nr:hypothetical protein [Sporocytophaga sp.]MBO9702259.1 hypothetical protein [Sporocytophaga sp.]